MPNIKAKTPIGYEAHRHNTDHRVRPLLHVRCDREADRIFLQKEIGFGYDGWNLVCETGTSGAASKTHAWGLDLSNTWQSAGGVGGLLLSKSASASYAPAFDGNGNVMAQVDATNGNLGASYEYGPFGELLKEAHHDLFGFSTTYRDVETGLLYYGSRYCSPEHGRWLNRDLLEEAGGISLALFLVHPQKVCLAL
jgi:RHS repeat-associated protein